MSISAIAYDLQVWTLVRSEIKRLTATDMRVLREIVGYHLGQGKRRHAKWVEAMVVVEFSENTDINGKSM